MIIGGYLWTKYLNLFRKIKSENHWRKKALSICILCIKKDLILINKKFSKSKIILLEINLILCFFLICEKNHNFQKNKFFFKISFFFKQKI
jgi:hypothetical protein